LIDILIEVEVITFCDVVFTRLISHQGDRKRYFDMHENYVYFSALNLAKVG
jgi:hypothetical protein